MTIIELGDVTPGSEREAPASPREFDRRVLRHIALVVVAVLTVLGVTGSARPRPMVIQTLWSIPFRDGDQYMIDGDTVYASTTGSGGRFVAYDLTGGKPRWSMTMPTDAGWPNEVEAARVLLMASGNETIALDSRSGAELWRRPGTPIAADDRTVLLTDHNGHGPTIEGLRLVRLRDGGIVWTKPAIGMAEMTTGGPDSRDPTYLITVRPDGSTEVFRWSDGVRVAAGRIPWRPGAGNDGTFSSVGADGRNLYIRLADGRGSSLTAYALDTLSQVWRQDGAARVSAYPCGPVVCSIEYDNFAAYDVVTGKTRWRAVGVQNASPVGAGRMVIAEGASDAYVLVDQLTGNRIAGLGRGVLTADYRGRTLFLLRAARSPADRTVISRVNPVTGAVSVRGTVSTFADYGCAFTADHAACPTTAGRLVVSSVG